MPPNNSSSTTPVALPCNQCTRSFINGTALADHRRSKHAIPCTFASCGRTFLSQDALKQHSDSAAHANKRGNPVYSLSKSSKELSPQASPSKTQLVTSYTPGTIPTTMIEFVPPVVVGKTSRALDPLAAHFESSLHISTPPQPIVGSSSSALLAPEEGILATKRPLVNNTSENGARTWPSLQTPKAQPAHKWKVIPKRQQYNALTALRLRCHLRAILKANEYILHTDHIHVMGEGMIPIFSKAPAYRWQTRKREAIALDCEMVGVRKNESEIARISAIDYLTGEILIDTLVLPTEPVTDWRTQYSGITKKAMTAAVSQGRILNGWPEARALLFEYMDTETVLVGQALHFDLIALHIQHQRVVDSAILASEAVGRNVKKRWGLKNLCDQLLNIKIQTNKQVGHDSVEDAFAAREVVLWCIDHPGALHGWGQRRRNEYNVQQQKKKQKQKTKKNAASQRQHSSYCAVNFCDHDEEDEILRWSDIAEDLGWPHPDTGYDPWSD